MSDARGPVRPSDGPDGHRGRPVEEPCEDDVRDDKQDLRIELLDRRRALSPVEIEQARQQVTDHVLARARAAGWRCVAGFVPLRTEPASVDLLDALRRSGVQVLVPVTLTDHDLDWMPWPGETVLGRGAIERADAILVPALAVAADGTRLGRGGGSYDRALPRARPGVPAAAIVYDWEVRPALPRAEWDAPVTVRVTPGQGWVPIG